MCNDPQSISQERLSSWYCFLNEVISVLAFTAALTSLQFGEKAPEVATVSLIFIGFLSYSLGSHRGVRLDDQRLVRYLGGLRVFVNSIRSTPVFCIGIGALVAVAFGADLTIIDGFSLKHLLM